MHDGPLLPDYEGACIANVVPALLGVSERDTSWVPPAALDADQVVLLVLDGLGWDQLAERPSRAPTMTGLAGRPIDSVVPTTTATALTSITTGVAPGEHGVVGYRILERSIVLNVLRWSGGGTDQRRLIPPEELQPITPFESQRPPVVTRSEFATSGFTGAHLRSGRFHGYRLCSTLVTEVAQLLRSGESFVYAYYDGLDKVSHEFGLGEHFDAELAACDRLVADLEAVLPSGAALVVTSDHGQVHTGDDTVALHPDLSPLIAVQSGEARLRWLHARSGRARALLDAATSHHGDQAWVCPVEQVIDEGWFGAKLTTGARQRLGDVALVARGTTAFLDPDDTGIYDLIGRHGSLTAAELHVPLLVSGG